MKKLFLTILFTISLAVVGFGQNYNQRLQQVQQLWAPNPNTIVLTNITLNQVQNGWAQMGSTCAGCASYYYQILATPNVHQAEDGKYYYYFFFKFFSNSYYTNGAQASTYLSQVNYYVNNELAYYDQYILVAPGEAYWGPTWIRCQDPNAIILFLVTQTTVY